MRRKIDLERAVEMRKLGMTLEEIAKVFDARNTAVSARLRAVNPDHYQPISEAGCIYPGVRKWMNREFITPRLLTVMMGFSEDDKTINRVRRALSGSKEIRIGDIKRIMHLSGMTFEEAFEDI